jgi:integral membrane protein
MATPKNPVLSALKLYRVASAITGSLLVAITILFAVRLTSQQDLWLAGPHGFLTFESYQVDDLGSKVGLPTVGLDLTTVVLIVHGWFYMLYLYTDFRLWSLMRWSFKRFLIIAAGGVVPLLSFFTERHYHQIAVAESANASTSQK